MKIKILIYLLSIGSLFLLPLEKFFIFNFLLYFFLILIYFLKKKIFLKIESIIAFCFLCVYVVGLFFKFENILPFTGIIIYSSLFFTSFISLIVKNPLIVSYKLTLAWTFSFGLSAWVGYILMPKLMYIFLPFVITALTGVLNFLWIKRTLLIFLLIIPSMSNASENSIFIKKIQPLGNILTHKDTLVHFLQMEEGKDYSFEDFEFLVQRDKKTLEDLGYFYFVDIYKVDENLIVEIEESRRWKFSGGKEGIFIGLGNIKGKGIFCAVELGKDFQEIGSYIPFRKDAFIIKLKHQRQKRLDKEKSFKVASLKYNKFLRKFFYFINEISIKERWDFSSNIRWDKRDSFFFPTTGSFIEFSFILKNFHAKGLKFYLSNYFPLSKNIYSNITASIIQFDKDFDIFEYFSIHEIGRFNNKNTQEYCKDYYILSVEVVYKIKDWIRTGYFYEQGLFESKNQTFPKQSYGITFKFKIPQPVGINLQFDFSKDAFFFKLLKPYELVV